MKAIAQIISWTNGNGTWSRTSVSRVDENTFRFAEQWGTAQNFQGSSVREILETKFGAKNINGSLDSVDKKQF